MGVPARCTDAGPGGGFSSDRSVQIRDGNMSTEGCTVIGHLSPGHICGCLTEVARWAGSPPGVSIAGQVFQCSRVGLQTGNDVSLESLGVHDQ